MKGLSLELHTGGITALLGHNGAGKTTAIGMLTGLIRPDGGDCRVRGKSMLTQAGAARRHLGYCPQHNVLFGGLTVQEHLHIFAAIKVGRCICKCIAFNMCQASFYLRSNTPQSNGSCQALNRRLI